MDIRKLMEKSLVPEKRERDLLQNFKSACPPEARNVAAFRVISKSLHLTQEVVRERMFAMTAETDLSLEDKRLVSTYDSILNFQMLSPDERAKFLSQTHATDSEMRRNPFLESTMEIEDSEERKISVPFHIPDYNGNHDPQHQFNMENPATSKLKASILKNVFGRPSAAKPIDRSSSQIELKSCFVKLFRLSDMQARVASHPRVMKEPSKNGKRKTNHPLCDLERHKHPSHPDASALKKRLPGSSIIQKQRQLPLTTAKSGSNNLAKSDVVQKSKTVCTPPPVSKIQELFVETKTITGAQYRPAKVTSLNEIVARTEPTTTNVEASSLKSPTPKIQEFSIFDCTHTPKKPHQRPLIYDEVYRRRLSSITSDDEKLTTAVVSSLLSPTLAKSSQTVPGTFENKHPRVIDQANGNGKRKLKTLSELNSKYRKSTLAFVRRETQRPPTNWCKSNDPSHNSLSRAKIVDAKQNGKFMLKNDNLPKPIKNFRIPLAYSSAEAAESSRTESSHCHWDKFPEQKRIMDDRFGNQLYFRGEKFFTQDETTPWRKSPEHELQVPYPPNAPQANSTHRAPNHGNPGYFGPKPYEQAHGSSTPPFSTYPDGKPLSSERTTFNLISDAINQDSASSPTEIMYPVHGALSTNYTCS